VDQKYKAGQLKTKIENNFGDLLSKRSYYYDFRKSDFEWGAKMKWFQNTFRLSPFRRGFHIITGEIENALPDIQNIQIGLAHVFIHHTSASLTINENADATVRADFETHFTKTVPENAPYWEHSYEGADDMPAHLKASIWEPGRESTFANIAIMLLGEGLLLQRLASSPMPQTLRKHFYHALRFSKIA
jgi:secondary thiamine-phosphate synthase enzyme